jgi:hypothetical protein
LIKKIRRFVYRYLLNNKAGKWILKLNFRSKFRSAADYWEKRYRNNGNSGTGSYGALAAYKASVLNCFIKENKIQSVIEFGCGDGNQLQQLQMPAYIGLDVSVTAIEKCISLFRNDASKSFFIYNGKCFADNSGIFKAELALSLDVIYHLLEDEVFESYMHHLFSAGDKFVVIYAWNLDGKKNMHVRYRKFTTWIETNIKDWALQSVIENKDPQPACDFFIYKKDQVKNAIS